MLSQLAIRVLTGNIELKDKISNKLGVKVQSINMYIRDNSDVGPLTSLAIINLIAEETGLTQEQIIQEKEAA